MLSPIAPRAPRRLPLSDPYVKNGKGYGPNENAEDILRSELPPFQQEAMPEQGGPAMASEAMGMPAINPAAAVVSAPKPLTMPDAPTFGNVAQYMEQQPQERSVQPQRNAQLVASLLGLGATALSGPSNTPVWGALGALGGGVAQGAGQSADVIQSEDEARRQAYIRGLSDVMGADTKAQADVYGQQVGAYNTQQREMGLDARNEANNQRAIQTAQMRENGDAFDMAVGAGDIESAVYFAEQMGYDPDAARSLAEESGRAIAEAERVKGAQLTQGERRLALQAAGLGIQRMNAVTARINATRPRATGGGGGGTSANAATRDANWLYTERNKLFSSYNSGEITQDVYRQQLAGLEQEYAARTGQAPTGAAATPASPTVASTAAVAGARGKYTTLLQGGAPLSYIIESVDNDPDLTPQQRDEIANELSRLLTGN